MIATASSASDRETVHRLVLEGRCLRAVVSRAEAAEGSASALARRAAERLAATGTDDARLANLFQAAYQRDPSAAERERFLHLLAGYPGVDSDRWAAVCRVLLSSNEFLHVE